MASSNLCVVCNNVVRPRQDVVFCDLCKHWHHRTCNSGIDRTFYRRAVKEKLDFPWICSACKSKVHCFLILNLILILIQEPNPPTNQTKPPTNQTAQIHSFDLDQLPHEQPPIRMEEYVYDIKHGKWPFFIVTLAQ